MGGNFSGIINRMGRCWIGYTIMYRCPQERQSFPFWHFLLLLLHTEPSVRVQESPLCCSLRQLLSCWGVFPSETIFPITYRQSPIGSWQYQTLPQKGVFCWG